MHILFHSKPDRFSIVRPLVALCLATVGLTNCGCATWSYNNIQIGQAPREYERLLPAEQTRRTSLGLCYYDVDSLGREDVIMILVSHNRRVAGKLRVQFVPRVTDPSKPRGLIMEAEIAPSWLGGELPGPADLLRYLLTRLADYHADNTTMRAHGWVVAAAIRLLEAQPNVEPITSMPAMFQAELERVPTGGDARAQVEPSRIRLHYSQPQAH